jgi:hypothetical protein
MPAKNPAVAVFIRRVYEIEAAQERIGRQLRGAKDVAPAVGLGVAEAQQLVRASSGVAPDPAMNVAEHIDSGSEHACGKPWVGK